MVTPTVLLGCNAIEDPNAGVAGTVLEIGGALAKRGWQPEYQFARADVTPRRERQMAYLRSLSASFQLRPQAAIIASGDGALFPVLRPTLPLIVHSHGLEHMARVASEMHDLPHQFGAGHRYIREPAVAFASRHADALVVQTRPQAQYAIEHYRAREDRVHVIPNAVDGSFFDIARTPTSRPTVVWIASWLPRKGTTWLPSVLTDLRRRVPEVNLHLIGTGSDERTVRDAFEADAQQNLTVTPRASRAEIRAALGLANVGLFSSAFEGFGRAPLEMAAAGLPIVSTDAGVAADIVKTGITGTIIPFNNPAATSTALAGYLNDAHLAEAHGDAARAVARSYDWETIGERWDRLLRAVVR